MTIHVREQLRMIGIAFPWILVFSVIAYMAIQQQRHDYVAGIERSQRIAYTDSIEDLDGVRIVADKDGKIRSWNRGAISLLGYSEKEAIGKPVEFVMPDELRREHHDVFSRAMRSPKYGSVRDFSCSDVLHANGSMIAVNIRVRIERRNDEPVAIATMVATRNLAQGSTAALASTKR